MTKEHLAEAMVTENEGRAQRGTLCSLPERRQLIGGLSLILLVAFLLRLYFALHFPNINYPDEIFQYIEQAHRLVFKYGVIPWEYRDGLRSWVVPGFLAGILKISTIFGISQPAFYLFLVTAVLSALSLSVVVVGFFWGLRTQGVVAAVITAVLCSVWFELIYFAPKTLEEPIAAHILVIAVYLAYPGRPIINKRRLFSAGLLFGLVAAIRVQLAPALVVAIVYICRRQIQEKWIPLVLGGLVTYVSAGMLDALTWHYPFQAVLSYIWVVVIEGKQYDFSVMPWYFYLTYWLHIWNGAVVPMMILALLAARKNLLLGLIAVTIIATHMLFAAKLYRYVFPAVPFIVILVGLGMAEVLDYIQKDIKNVGLRPCVTLNLILTTRVVTVLGWIVISAVLASSNNFRYYWFRGADDLRAFQFLHDKADLCGVGLLDLSLMLGGYTHLHRDVPLIISARKNLAESFSAYNYAIAIPRNLPHHWPYAKVRCWGENVICVYRRDGSCKSAPNLEINEFLRRHGW